MGTQAHWFSYRWRYREGDALAWTYAPTLTDAKEDVAGTDVPVEVQKRIGTKAAGYEYEPHSTIAPEMCRCDHPMLDHGRNRCLGLLSNAEPCPCGRGNRTKGKP